MPVTKNEVYLFKYARSLEAAGRGNVDQILTGIVGLHGPDAIDPERTRAEIIGQCDLLARSTDEHQTNTAALDQALAEGIQVRDERDEQATVLRDMLIATRGEVRECFGGDSLRIYRLDERNPASREGLARYAGAVLALLEQNPRTEVDVLGKAVSTMEMAASLSAALGAYRSGLDNAAREARETEIARVRRAQSEARFRRVLFNVAAILVGYLRLAGLDALADRIRPKRARGGAAVDPEAPDTEEPAPDVPAPDVPAPGSSTTTRPRALSPS